MPSKAIVFRLTDTAPDAETKNTPVAIKEASVRITFKVNHSIVTGLRHVQMGRRAGLKGRGKNDYSVMFFGHSDQMVDSNSYKPHPTGEAYVKDFPEQAYPSGMIGRSGRYYVRRRVVDSDGEIHAEPIPDPWRWYTKYRAPYTCLCGTVPDILMTEADFSSSFRMDKDRWNPGKIAGNSSSFFWRVQDREKILSENFVYGKARRVGDGRPCICDRDVND
ncbi:hypothetical protein DFH08DRAFT_806073 [Mycena albidolilacea]|uniref:Uncharacterized protein n=1 Tax=Mycena albidolilacea TaxID=1033008 RepID=A0AAD7EUS3_9AGAR|nr:hypothetical protein DFH08DRAFT_806073 [Mycena albidolilacea]